MASSCIGEVYVEKKMSLVKEWSDIGTGCPGKWLIHHP